MEHPSDEDIEAFRKKIIKMLKDIHNSEGKRHQRTKALPLDHRNLYAIMFPLEDNYQVQKEVRDEVTKRTGIMSSTDVFADDCGFNSTSPFFYSSRTNGFLQVKYLCGIISAMNPPYDKC